MRRRSFVRRRGLPSGRQWLHAIEATTSLAVASAAIRVLPFRLAIKLGSAKLGASRGAETGQTIEALRWAVEGMARRVPWRAVCFQQGLALQHMLRRRGIDARLRYGMAQGTGRAPEAHVWVTVEGVAVLGGEEARRFSLLASYPRDEG